MATPFPKSTSSDLQASSLIFDIALIIDSEGQWEFPKSLDMRLNTIIPGVIISVGKNDTPHVQTMVSYNFEGLHLQDPEDGNKEIRDVTASWLPLQFQSYKREEDEYKQRRETDKSLSSASYEATRNGNYQLRKKVRLHDDKLNSVHEVQGDDRGMQATSSAPGKGFSRRVKQFAIFIGPERTVDPALALRAREVVLGNNAPNYLMGNSSPKPCRSSKAPHTAKSQRTTRARRAPKCENPPCTAPSFEAEITHIPVSKFCILSQETEAESISVKDQSTVDSYRSELTWKDEEITGYDPSDPEDDGEGINGIGFRPTPHEAYLRSQKRKRQLAEYRIREATEARKLRSERRNLATVVRDKIKEGTVSARKVRFLGL